jgi:hypothetical protein
MDPISSQFSYEYQKFVLQEPNVHAIQENYHVLLRKPFELYPHVKTAAAKKDLNKGQEQPTQDKSKGEKK